MTVVQYTDSRVALSLHEMLGGPVPDVQPKAAAQTPPQPQTQPQPPAQPPQSPGDDDGSAAGAAQRKGFQPYHAQSVPKTADLQAHATERATAGVPITTMMLRNIPNKYTQATLMSEIDEHGFAGTYNFFYLPMDVHNRSNVGYAFINFVAPHDAERFGRIFSQHRFQRFQSRKISSVCTAHVQGLDENLRHFENRAVTHARNDQYRPVVLKGNVRVDFEDAVAEVKARLQAARPNAAAAGGARAPKQQASSAPSSPPPGLEAAGQPPRQSACPAREKAGYPRPPTPPGLVPGAVAMPAYPGVWPPEAFAPAVAAAAILPPGLAHAGAPAGQPLVGSDVAELLSLKGLLVDRLHKVIEQAAFARQLSPFHISDGSESPIDDSPAYVHLPSYAAPRYHRYGAKVADIMHGRNTDAKARNGPGVYSLETPGCMR